jgi:hypothetical protein
MKRALRVLLVIVAIAGSLVTAGRLYLRAHVKENVTSKLEAAYGGVVQVDAVDIGLNTSSVAGVKLYEKQPTTSGRPWVRVASVDADVSVLSILNGDTTPHHIMLKGAAITLRFSKTGKLLTELPVATGPMKLDTLPDLQLEQGAIKLEREDGAVLDITNVNATLRRQDSHFVLIGTAGNSSAQGWGMWTLRSTFAVKDDHLVLALKSDRPLHVTQAMLDQLPFIPPTLWEDVKVDGTTPVEATLHYDLKDHAAHYRVALQPFNTMVQVPPVEVKASDVRGQVLIDGEVVKLTDVQSSAFGGKIKINGVLDFSGKASDLKFPVVEAQRLDTRLLPKSWGLPPETVGQLNGHAWLEVILAAGKKPMTRGEGQAEIDNARVAGQPTSEPVRLELHACDGGFGFHGKNTATSRLPTAQPQRPQGN